MFRRMTRERYLSDAELAAFMRAVRERRHKHQPRDYAFFSIVANLGIRPAEARELIRSDVHVHNREPSIQLRRVHPRHAPEPSNWLPLNKEVARIVRGHVDSMLCRDRDAALFPITKRQSERLFHYYRHKAGITLPYKLYALRHSVGMRLWRHTEDLRLMQAIMGHVRLKATAAYVHVSPARILATQSALRSIG